MVGQVESLAHHLRRRDRLRLGQAKSLPLPPRLGHKLVLARSRRKETEPTSSKILRDANRRVNWLEQHTRLQGQSRMGADRMIQKEVLARAGARNKKKKKNSSMFKKRLSPLHVLPPSALNWPAPVRVRRYRYVMRRPKEEV